MNKPFSKTTVIIGSVMTVGGGAGIYEVAHMNSLSLDERIALTVGFTGATIVAACVTAAAIEKVFVKPESNFQSKDNIVE